MKKIVYFLFFTFFVSTIYAQKDSLNIGDRYAEDQIYASISYVQLYNQPSSVSKSGFSYAISTGFIKDFIINKVGSVSFAAGIGYGVNFINHKLKVDEVNNTSVFSTDNTLVSNEYRVHNLEFPLELRWRTSTANKYKFWRIYTGIKFLYNFSNKFEYLQANNVDFSYSNISSYNKLQYGLTLSAGYDAFNIFMYYGLTPVYENATINGENIDTKILKFGLIFYIL